MWLGADLGEVVVGRQSWIVLMLLVITDSSHEAGMPESEKEMGKEKRSQGKTGWCHAGGCLAVGVGRGGREHRLQKPGWWPYPRVLETIKSAHS